MSRTGFEGLTTRTALFLGFGLIVGIWAFTGYRFILGIADIERQAARINGPDTRAPDLLAPVRAQVLLGSVVVRDALLDPNATNADDYRRQLTDTYRGIDDALQQYV